MGWTGLHVPIGKAFPHHFYSYIEAVGGCVLLAILCLQIGPGFKAFKHVWTGVADVGRVVLVLTGPVDAVFKGWGYYYYMNKNADF